MNCYDEEYCIHAKIYYMNTEFNNWISEKLRELGWSQADLAKRSGLRPGTISNIMTGTRDVSPESAQKIARAFREPVSVAFEKAGFLKKVEAETALEEKLLSTFRLLPENEKKLIIRQIQGTILLLEQQGIIINQPE